MRSVTVVRIGIGQINTRVGDLEGNVDAISSAIRRARDRGVELMLFPEMAVTGCPVEDLAFRGSFLKASERAVQEIAGSLKRSKMVVVVGGMETGVELFNAAAVIHRGEVLGWARKRRLFSCGSIDEFRYFSAGEKPLVIETEAFRAAVTIGDDLGYPVFPAEIELLVSLWNEPYHYGHRPVKETMMRERAKEDAVAIAMVSPAGGQDDMIFEGSSVIVDGFGETLARGRAFAEDLVIADLDLSELKAHRERSFHSARPSKNHLAKAQIINVPGGWPERKRPAAVEPRIEPLLRGHKEIFRALALATGDYIVKNGFDRAIVGASGGIDSALTLVIAAEALGRDRVTAVSMPGPYTSTGTRRDAGKLADGLGVEFKEISIKRPYDSMLKSLDPAFEDLPRDVTEENLQARLRGLILMSMSNKLGAMVLATGNKSEAACGYCTLYGDTCGAFAPLADVYKSQVYELAEWYNRRAGEDMIPRSVIERAPSAELRPDQTDQDALPPYPELDRILRGILEREMSIEELIEEGEEPDTVYSVMRMLMAAEFKRNQAAIGPTVSERPLSDLRLPITKSTEWWLTKKKPASGKSRKKSKRSKRK
jgi:NAD+ synthase (glutamine-hydrolysing)